MNIILPFAAAGMNLLAMWFYGRKQTRVAPWFAFANALILIVANVMLGQPWMMVPPLLNIGINTWNIYKSYARKESNV